MAVGANRVVRPTLRAQLTRDLLAIAKFLVHFTVVSTNVDQLLSYWEHSIYQDNLQHISHLAYILISCPLTTRARP